MNETFYELNYQHSQLMMVEYYRSAKFKILNTVCEIHNGTKITLLVSLNTCECVMNVSYYCY